MQMWTLARRNLWRRPVRSGLTIIGLAVGVLPKTMMVAFFGNSIMNAFQGEFVTAAVMAALAIIVWIVIAFIVRRIVRRGDKDDKATD